MPPVVAYILSHHLPPLFDGSHHTLSPPVSVFIPESDEVALGIAQCIRVSWILSIQGETPANTCEANVQAR